LTSRGRKASNERRSGAYKVAGTIGMARSGVILIIVTIAGRADWKLKTQVDIAKGLQPDKCCSSKEKLGGFSGKMVRFESGFLGCNKPKGRFA
jgi:hypothetical protein